VNWGAKPSKALAVALMLWCAGTGCMMVSYARAGDTESAVAESSSPSAEDMAGMPACHAQHHKNRKVTTSKTPAAVSFSQLNLPLPNRSGAMSCCPLTSGSIAAASRSQSNSSVPALAKTGSALPDLIASRTAPVAVPLRLPNRAHSYLLDCAFLI
jgi:hypothetical protein